MSYEHPPDQPDSSISIEQYLDELEPAREWLFKATWEYMKDPQTGQKNQLGLATAMCLACFAQTTKELTDPAMPDPEARLAALNEIIDFETWARAGTLNAFAQKRIIEPEEAEVGFDLEQYEDEDDFWDDLPQIASDRYKEVLDCDISELIYFIGGVDETKNPPAKESSKPPVYVVQKLSKRQLKKFVSFIEQKVPESEVQNFEYN
jgi:hypothetical protein